MALETVYLSTNPSEIIRLKGDSTVVVTRRPPSDWKVLLECHPQSTDIKVVDEDRLEVQWQAIMNRPYRMSTR